MANHPYFDAWAGSPTFPDVPHAAETYFPFVALDVSDITGRDHARTRVIHLIAADGFLVYHYDPANEDEEDGVNVVWDSGDRPFVLRGIKNINVALGDLSNVNVVSPTDGDALFFDGDTGLWLPQAPQAPSSLAGFLVHKNSTDQTGIADSTATLITFSTARFDIGAHFSSNAWTPPAGLVALQASLFIGGTVAAGNLGAVSIYKNGSPLAQGEAPASTVFNGAQASVSVRDVANGTDSYSVYGYLDTSSGTATAGGNPLLTNFSGHWISS